MTQANLKKINGIPSWLKGIAISYAISFIFIIFLPVLIQNGMITMENTIYIIPVIQVLSVFAGVYFASKATAGNKLVASALVGTAYFIASLSVAILFFEGISSQIWTGVVCCLIGVIMAVIVGTGKKRRSRPKKRRTV